MKQAFGFALLLAAVTAGCDQPRPSVEVVAFGDSATSGPSEQDYIEWLADDLAIAAEDWANEGNGGETAVEGAARLQMLLDRGMYPNAQVLLYWQGGNDLIDAMQQVDPLLLFSPAASDYPFREELDGVLARIQQAIEGAIAAAQGAGLQVFVANYFNLQHGSFECPASPIGVLLPEQAENGNGYVALLNERIAQAAAQRQAVLVDVASLNSELASDAGYYENCNHLSARGNALVAELFVQALIAAGFGEPEGPAARTGF